MNLNNIIAVDIETTGLSPWKDEIICIGVYNDSVQRVFRSTAEFIDFVSKHDYYYVGQNFKFDMKFLRVHHRPCNALSEQRWRYDTQLMHHVLPKEVPKEYLEWYEEQRKLENKKLPQGVSHRQARGNSLKVLAPYYLNVPPFWEDPTNHDNDEYVLKDCEYTWRLFKMFHEGLEEHGCSDFYNKYMQPWARMLLRAELKGVTINQDEFQRLERFYRDEESTLRSEIDEMWSSAHRAYVTQQISEIRNKYSEMSERAVERLKDTTKVEGTRERYQKLAEKAIEKVEPMINYASDKQMLWLLRDYFGYNCTDFEGKESTGKAVLEKLAKEGHEDVGLFLKWRKTEKINTSYFPAYRELQHKGVIHPTFNLAGTRTGRLSSSDPNFQQIPAKLYSMFKPRDGYTFLQYDLSGIEAALIALYSDDKALYDIIVSGQSIHNVNAKVDLELDCEVDEVKSKYPVERQAAKNTGFACFYGAGWRRIKATYQAAGIIITDERARSILRNRKRYFANAFAFHKEITDVFASGEIVPNLLGRPIKIHRQEDSYMKGFNTLVQSSASDLNVRAAQKSQDEYDKLGIDATVLALVHDFILVEVKKEHADEANDILVQNMTGFNLKCSHGKIPLAVEGCINDVWQK